MAHEFRLQDPGEGIHEAEVIEIPVKEGDDVKEGDTVLVAETDKAAVDIPSPVTGKITEIKVSQGDVAEVGDLLMTIEDQTAKEPASSGDGDGKEEAEEQDADQPAEDEGSEADEPANRKQRKKEPTTEAKTGGASQSQPEPQDRHEEQGENGESRPSGTRATPVVRGLAKELDVDLAAVSGSGEDGRIDEDDVRKAAEEQAGPTTEADRKSTAEDGDEHVPLRSIRRAMARRMSRAWAQIPHAVHHDAIGIDALEHLRHEHAEEVEAAGGKLTLTPFLLKALAAGVREYPRFNATFDAEQEEMVLHRAVNLGVALDTDRGLLVPVIRNVERKSVLELAVELTELAERLRNNRAEQEVLRGGTFTLTNIGSLGGTGFSPIINPPQVAIFGAARADLRQVVIGSTENFQNTVLLVLPVCIAFDHRVIDGAEAARFMNTVKAILGDPAELALRG